MSAQPDVFMGILGEYTLPYVRANKVGRDIRPIHLNERTHDCSRECIQVHIIGM